jgi:hypothetical protein
MLHHSARGRLKFCILAAFVFGSAATFAACSSPHSVVPAVPATRMAHPLTTASSTPTPFAFTFTTIDNPKSSTFSQLWALDDLQQVVGSVGVDSAGDEEGFTAPLPYSKFFTVKYPGATSTVVRGQNPGGRILCGYFFDGIHTWGFIRNHSIYNAFKDAQTPKGPSTNELLGINDDGIAVGFYVDSTGKDHAYEVQSLHFVGIKPPNAVSAKAVAITLSGYVAGDETLSNGNTEGWFLRDGTFIEFTYPGSTDTEVYGLSDGAFDNIIVGSYVDGSGNTHGFLLRNPTAGKDAIWQTLDEPNAAGTTVVTGMNNHHAITGYYVDSSGNTNGFLATLTT